MRIKVCGAYAIRNIHTGKVYVGSSSSIKDRWHQHRSDLRRNRHHSILLQRAWNKHGEGAFEFVVLETCQPDKLFEVEAAHIEALGSANPRHGYNTLLRPGSGLGYRHTPEARQRMSNSHKAIPKAERLKFCRSFIGKRHTPETRARMAEAARRRWADSPELKSRMSAQFKGKKRSEADRQKMREGCARRRASLGRNESAQPRQSCGDRL